MTNTTEDSIWCDLASQWIASNGLEDLDALQHARFLDHSAQCQHCSSLLHQVVSWPESFDAEPAVEWPHLADETLRAMIVGDFSETEKPLVQAVEPHLLVCEECANRFEAMQEWPEIPDSREAVVGRAVSIPIRWIDDQAELSWVIDQAAIAMSVWRISLRLSSGFLAATLSVEGNKIPNQWKFSLLLATDEEFLPALVFSSASLTMKCGCTATTTAKWRATPIITMPLPIWTKLVSVGEEPATMVSLEDAKRRELALTVPYGRAVDYEEIAPWLNTLLVNLRGERLECRLTRSQDEGELVGVVMSKGKQLMGDWRLRIREDGLINLVITPDLHSVIRFATLTDNDIPLVPSIDVSKQPQEFERKIPLVYRLIDRQAERESWILNPLRWLQHWIEVPLGQFHAGREFAPVLGSATREHELDLSHVLKEVDLDSYFEDFKLIIREENQMSASVRLVPLRPLEGMSERPLELETQIYGIDDQPRGTAMILRLATETSSRYVPIKGSFDVDEFAGKVKVTIREIPPVPISDDDE